MMTASKDEITPPGYLNLSGTYRSCSVKETLERLKPLFPKIGITRLADITGLDTIGIPVITSIRPMAKHLSVSQGKGLSCDLAKISAVMEAIECYHMENPPDSSIKGSYEELKESFPVVHPVYFNTGALRCEKIEQHKFEWLAVTNLVNQEEVYIPQILTNLNSTMLHSEYSFLSVTTNGIAAGNNMDEALCHALYEVIERDNLTSWSALQEEERSITQIDLTTLVDDNKALLKLYQQANIPIKVWDVTTNIKVPTFHCAIGDHDKLRNLGTFTGTGAHLSADIALSRALTEAAQSRLTYISGSRDDILPAFYSRRGQLKFISSREFGNGIKKISNCSQPDFAKSFHENVEQLKMILSKKGYNYICAIDHTKPEINIPVVQVIVPGLKFKAARM